MTETLRVFLLLEGIGLAALPLASRALARLPGRGLGMAKPLGVLLLGWLVWFGGSLGIPNGWGLPVGAALVLLGVGAVLVSRRTLEDFERRAWLSAEILFALAFLGAALYMSYSPDVWGTEKPMDMALTNATITSPSFPPHDPWLSGEQLNYYYVGQLLAGVLIRLTRVEPTAGYNLAMAAIFALAVVSAYTLGGALAEAGRREGLPVRRPLLGGAGVVVMMLLAGNLRGGWLAIEHTGSLSSFDWFGPSRVIPNTINEFPFFSLVVGDLHAHLIAVPLTLLGLAFAVQAGLYGPPRFLRGAAETVLAALSIGILYAVNSWSWPVVAGLWVIAVAVRLRDGDMRKRRLTGAAWGASVLVLGVVMVLPFILGFDPNARGFGFTNGREPLGDFLRHHAVMEGLLLFVLVAPLLSRLRRARHPGRVTVWGTALAAVALTLLSGPHLAGAAAVALLLAVALEAVLNRSLTGAERMLWLFAAGGLACLVAPELVYVRDEFDGTQFVRMNTVFKMGYQAWLLLAVAGGVALAWSRLWLPRVPRAVWQLAVLAGIVLSLAYTVAGSAGRKAGFTDGPRLDGRRWLAASAPGDPPAIDWLRAHADGDAVVLEAVGDDYSAFGNARISTYTGLATVLGWQGHELQWSHSVGTRRADVQTLYTSADTATVRALLARYHVAFAVLGPLERTTYGTPGALASVGRVVFDREGTQILAFPVARKPALPSPAPPFG